MIEEIYDKCDRSFSSAIASIYNLIAVKFLRHSINTDFFIARTTPVYLSATEVESRDGRCFPIHGKILSS